jgi:DtxR family Mn-dependent transcriptional regulator
MPVLGWIFVLGLVILGFLLLWIAGRPWWISLIQDRQRERIEDALKHLLDRELQGRHASPESLAGVLQLSPKKAMEIIAQMELQGLLLHQGFEIHLTAEGERWAMQIVRAHRLWERYLADEARMPLGQIHGEAHRREHTLTGEQLDALDAALGHPTSDPHGDPIPDRQGQMREKESIPLTALQAEGSLRIVHLEDEPVIAYEQILAAGLRLGQTIRVLEKSSERYVLSDGENEFRLAPSVAANVHVVQLPESATIALDMLPLWQLQHNQRAEVVMLDDAVQGFTRRRFLDLGLTPGTVIFPELLNFFGDPRAYRVRGTLIALRKDQANQIWVKPV